jgi:hypothetical protein
MHGIANHEEIVGRFGSIARRFCAVVDSASSSERADLVRQIYQILPKLIDEAVRLPELELSDRDDSTDGTSHFVRKPVGLNDEECGHLYNVLKEKLLDWDLYWQVFDPTKDHEAIRGSLADDIADIYRDLRKGLILFETHQAPEDEIIWLWRLLFHSHWGAHAMESLRTIHFLLSQPS